LNLKDNYQKFNKHLKANGGLYAFGRGIKYFGFLIKKQREKFEPKYKNVIAKGSLKIVFPGHGVNIIWNDEQITQGAGLNVGINTLGLWTDSTKADWQVLEKSIDYFRFKVKFEDLPITQIWDFRIENEQEINWNIDIEIEENLYIDEFRVICLLSHRYKTWFNGYQQDNFPRITMWQDMPLNDTSGRFVGVRFPTEGVFLPAFGLEFSNNNYTQPLPLIQNTSKELNAHVIGARMIDIQEKKYYLTGKYNVFSGKIILFKNDESLDTKIENLRKVHFKDVQRYLVVKKKKSKVLLVNLPWQRNGVWGVRAGSRWPHIKDESEGNYLPFPFFLAYATALLQKHNIQSYILDAIAEKISEDDFIKKISDMDFDYFVAETSVPSFYDDLRMLERIHKKDVPIILCGPHVEIYNPQFLKDNLFIDFVLCGEYEFTLLELIKSLQENKDLSKIKGLIYRNNNGIIKNPPREPFDINLLPWPQRDTLPMEKYWDLPGDISYPSAQMLASRGCPFSCNFCLWPQVMYPGNHYRTREIKDVVDEMEYLVKEKGVNSIYFDDDTFNIGKERMLGFCREIRKRGLNKTQWAIMARPDLMDEEILNEMRSAGLWAVKYGVESISEKLLKNYQKNMDFQKTDQIIKMTKKLGISVHLTFTFGIFGENKDTIQKTLDYILNLDPSSVQFSILTPFPGTKLFEELDKQGRILIKDWSKYDGHYNCVFKPDNLSPEDLGEAKRMAYRIWGEHVRNKRGWRGDIQRFKDYMHEHGLKRALYKTLDYLIFIRIKRQKYLNGKD